MKTITIGESDTQFLVIHVRSALKDSVEVVLTGGHEAENDSDLAKLVKWSDINPPPALGEKISPKCSYRGAPFKYFVDGVVDHYAVEFGYLYAVTKFAKLPRKYWSEDHGCCVWVAGVDLLQARKKLGAGCPRCGGWTTMGGMSQYASCICNT